MNTEFPPTLSEALEQARRQLSDSRSFLEDAVRHYGMFGDRVKDVTGLLTCGLVTLAHHKGEAVKVELAGLDRERGPHLPFRPRGIGLDSCPGCFVCGAAERDPAAATTYLNNISAFVESKEDGETIVSWFPRGARLDFRPSEPKWIQVKVGACDAHKKQLEALYTVTSKYGVIRQRDVFDLVKSGKMVGAVHPLRDIPGWKTGLDLLRARIEAESERVHGDDPTNNLRLVAASIQRGEVLILTLTDVHPQHQQTPSSLFKRFDLMMLKPGVMRLVEKARRVVLACDPVTSINSDTRLLWIKDNDVSLPTQIKKLGDIIDVDVQALKLFRERLSFKNREAGDDSMIWEAAKRGVVVVFCRSDLHSIYQHDPSHTHVLDITPYHLREEARELLAVAKRVVFANATHLDSPDIPCVWWKGERDLSSTRP